MYWRQSPAPAQLRWKPRPQFQDAPQSACSCEQCSRSPPRLGTIKRCEDGEMRPIILLIYLCRISIAYAWAIQQFGAEMPDPNETLEVLKAAESPLVFISHDSRDAELAEAFSKLLKSVSAGMMKSFRSSDRKGTEGIEFGDEWYKKLMSMLGEASDVVCLLTEQSLDRPWILYEAGVAKGKLGTPVHGVALGVSLSRVSVGPFYQFQNSDDNEGSITKLVLQLCRRIKNLEPDPDVVKSQVRAFKENVAGVLKTIGSQKTPEKHESINEGAVAKVLEEMKLIVRELSMRFEKQMMEGVERVRPRRFPLRRFHPRMMGDMAHVFSRHAGDPLGILMVASLVRDDFPWLYELGLEAYRAAKRGNSEQTQEALVIFRDATDFTLRGPFAEEMGLGSNEIEGLRELPSVISHLKDLAEETPSRKRVPLVRPPKPGGES